MTYLLILPICLYIALAVITLARYSRGAATVTFALYLVSVSIVTAGFLVLGTTASLSTAKLAGYVVVIGGSWCYAILLPLTLVGLCFEHWLYANRRRVTLVIVLTMAVSTVFLVWIPRAAGYPLVLPVTTSAWIHWILAQFAFHWPYSLVLLAVSQFPYMIIVAFFLHYRRLAFWHGAVSVTLATLSSILIPLVAPLAGAHWLVLVVALGLAPPVTVFWSLLPESSYSKTFGELAHMTMHRFNDGLAVLDDGQRVIWYNMQIGRWLGRPPLSSISPPPVTEWLAGIPPLLTAVQGMLASGVAQDECTVALGDAEYVLQVELRPLEPASHHMGRWLLVTHDVTTEYVRRDLQERRQELLALSAISTDIASSLDLDQVISRAVQQVHTVTEADGAAVYLLEDHQLRLAGHLLPKDLPRLVPDVFDLDINVITSPVNKTLEQHYTTTIADTQIETKIGVHLQQYGYRAGAFVPLIAREEVTGLLLLGYKEPHQFQALEVSLLDSVGRQLAVAIQNARLHAQERQQRRIAEVLREVAGIVASKSLDEALLLILERLHVILTYERATVLVLAEPGMLRIGASVGFETPQSPPESDQVRIAINHFQYLERLFEERIPQLVSDTTVDPMWQPGQFAYYSWLAVPLIVRDQVLGCISLSHQQAGHFTQDDLLTASTFASQAAVAVENSQLFDIEQRRRVQAELLQQASYDLVTSPDIDTALASALHHLRRVTAFDRAHVGLFEADGESWSFWAVYPPTGSVPLNQPLPASNYPLVLRIIKEKRPLLISETRDQPDWRTGRLQGEEVRAWLGIPLIVRGDVIGLLSFDSWKPDRFLEEHVQIGQTFANQIAAALESFRLLDETERQGRAHQVLNTILATSNEALTHENLLQEALDRALQTLGLHGGAIHQYVPATHALRLRAMSGLSSVLCAHLDPLTVSEPLSTYVLPPKTLLDGTPCTFLSVPLVSHGSPIGLLSILEDDTQFISPDMQQLLLNIGQQLGVVMDNAILFEDTARRATLSTDLARLSLAISAQLDHESVLNLICRESIGVFGVDGAYLWLVQQSKLVGAAAYGPSSAEFIGHIIDRSDSTLLPVDVLHSWRPSHIHHAGNSDVLPADFMAMTGAQAALAIPLVKADLPVGTLLLVDTLRPTPFTDTLADQVGVFGVQAALAIDNARLFDEVRRRLDQLRLVNEVGRYATAILSEDALIRGIAAKLFDILRFETISLLQVDEGTLHVRAAMVRGNPDPLDYPQEYHQSTLLVANQAYEQAELCLLNQRCHLSGRMQAPQPCCSLGIPLIVADEVIGVLVVERQNFDSIGQEDLDVLEPLSAQLAVSLSNARLYDQVRQQALDLEVRVIQRTAEIRRQHKRIEAILRSVADSVIVFDLEKRVVMTNPVARSMFDRFDLEMDLGGRVRELVQQVMQLQDGMADVTEIIELGHVTFQAKASRVVEEDAVLGSVVVLRDISRLQDLDRMKDLFVQTVSHELRTPLANLKLYLSLLQKGRPERREIYVEVMEREVERLARLISDLLEISRLQGEQRAERTQMRMRIDLLPLINTVVHGYNAWAENEDKRLVHENLTQGLPPILGDPDQIERALTNLVSNAIRYTTVGGQITVRSYANSGEQSRSEWVIIEVIDTGIGIPASELATVFERFVRGSNVSPNIPGTGLGLAITREIVGLHGGTLEVESQEGHGSIFRIALPVLQL